MIEHRCPSYVVTLHMAGDLRQTALFIQRYAIENPMCVTLTAQTYIYTGGCEEGFAVGFINYPRFPNVVLTDIRDRAVKLGHHLIEHLGQHSFSVVTPVETIWFSRRERA